MYRSQTYEELNEFADTLFDLCYCSIFGLFGRMRQQIDICDMIEDKCNGGLVIDQDIYAYDTDEKFDINCNDNKYLFDREKRVNLQRCEEQLQFATPGEEASWGKNFRTSRVVIFLFSILLHMCQCHSLQVMTCTKIHCNVWYA